VIRVGHGFSVVRVVTCEEVDVESAGPLVCMLDVVWLMRALAMLRLVCSSLGPAHPAITQHACCTRGVCMSGLLVVGVAARLMGSSCSTHSISPNLTLRAHGIHIRSTVQVVCMFVCSTSVWYTVLRIRYTIY
jgi:hypothetical protein